MSDRSDRGLFTVRSEGADACRVTVAGEMDASNAHALEGALLSIEAGGASRIVLDLGSLEFIDSTGLAVIVRAHERAEGDGHRLGVTRPQGVVARTFEVVGLDQELDFVE